MDPRPALEVLGLTVAGAAFIGIVITEVAVRLGWIKDDRRG